MRLEDLLSARQGHFLLESGHHGSLWLELDALFVRPDRLSGLVKDLAARLRPHDVQAVCGPATGGALLAQSVALDLGAEFYYAERVDDGSAPGLYQATYRLPAGPSAAVAGKRTAVVDDVINAGSSVRATMSDLRRLGAPVVALGALLVLGNPAHELAHALDLPLESLAQWQNEIYPPEDCPLCAEGMLVQPA